MEQYVMPGKMDAENLRTALDQYHAEHIYIRAIGSRGGTVKVNENLDKRTLDFHKDNSGLHLLIDTKEVFTFKEEADDKGFSLAYERITPDNKLVMLSRGENPYDPTLPEPTHSILRHGLDFHLLEITFPGRVHLAFHSWWIEPDWKYWKLVSESDFSKTKK
jgi:hypothetical protein